MSSRIRYLLCVVFLLAALSAIADRRERATAFVQTETGEKCATCAAYAPVTGKFCAKPTVERVSP